MPLDSHDYCSHGLCEKTIKDSNERMLQGNEGDAEPEATSTCLSNWRLERQGMPNRTFIEVYRLS